MPDDFLSISITTHVTIIHIAINPDYHAWHEILLVLNFIMVDNVVMYQWCWEAMRCCK